MGEKNLKSRLLTYSYYLLDPTPPRRGIAIEVPAKPIVRLTTSEGPQMCDLNIWNQHNPRERFWAARTRQLHSAHVSTYDRLWSILPFLRPLVIITADTLGGRHTEWGGRINDTLGTRCDPYVDKLISGEDNDFHCHSNLVRAVLPLGLTEFDVHDVLNVFQATGLNEYDQYFMEASPATKDDYFEIIRSVCSTYTPILSLHPYFEPTSFNPNNGHSTEPYLHHHCTRYQDV